MLLFAPRGRSGTQRSANKQVLVFGSGLIGRAVERALLRRGHGTPVYLPFTWLDPDAQDAQLARLMPQLGACDLVWAAGKAGFGAAAAELAVEHRAFLRVLETCQTALGSALRVHLISSAGGLYEGQCFVDEASTVAPHRPYGEAKIRMEEALEAALDPEQFQIYRPSSVFGYAHGGRLNLVSTAIIGALNRRPVKIFGHPATLRDYVFAQDLGQFIGDQITREQPFSGERLILASGKPSTIDEMIQTVSRLMQHPVMLHYDLSPSNSLNNSYRSSVRPQGFALTPQIQAIQQTARMIAMEHSLVH